MIEKRDTAWSGALRFAASLVVLACGLATATAAQDCPQGPIAVADEAIFEGWNPVLVDVLANDIEESGKALEVELMGSTCDVDVSVEHGLMRLDFDPTTSADCVVSYRLRDDSGEVSSTVDVAVEVSVLLVFEDDLETGNTSLWSPPEA